MMHAFLPHFVSVFNRPYGHGQIFNPLYLFDFIGNVRIEGEQVRVLVKVKQDRVNFSQH